MSDVALKPVPIPPLVELLAHTERVKGRALTEEEVISLRDNAVCMNLPESAAASLAESRGYRDIDPEHVWEEWSEFRRRGQT